MTRINTNVSSLNAQKSLARSNDALQEALTRLSTGLRINVGKDDPAGLIASEVLRSDIVSVQRAITNSERANQMIATADSSLGQVSSLLNDIRGLVSEAANTGALSTEQIEANQLQVDSSLEAIDRISQVTSFQGKRLLDGNMDFITSGVDTSSISDLQIDQANFGTQSSIGVSIDVVAQATKGELNYSAQTVSGDVVLEVGGATGYEAFSFASGSSIQDLAAAINLVSDALGITATVESSVAATDMTGSVTASSYGADNDITITADAAGADEGDIAVKFVKPRDSVAGGTDGDAMDINYTAPTGTEPGFIEVVVETDPWVAADFTATKGNAANFVAQQNGAQYQNIAVTFVDDAAGFAASDASFTYVENPDGSGALTITGDFTVDNTTEAGLKVALALGKNAQVAALFSMPGTGTANITAGVATVVYNVDGVDGGAIVSTAAEVVTEFNDHTVTHSVDLDGVATAVAADALDTGVVTVIEEYVTYGTANTGNTATDTNDLLQFVGPKDSRNISFRFVASQANQTLSVDLDTEAAMPTTASAVLQGIAANTTFTVTSLGTGAAWDDITITLTDVAAGFGAVVWDPEGKTLDIYENFDTGAIPVSTVLDLINNDTIVGELFHATILTGDGTTAFDNTTGTGAPSTETATTAGGIGEPGTVIVNLATDASAAVTTTAAQLVAYFTANQADPDLTALGITAGLAGTGNDGSGLLAATTNDLAFGTAGYIGTANNAEVTTYSGGGETAQLIVSAKTTGAAYNGVEVAFAEADLLGADTATFAWDSIARRLTITIDDGPVTTAAGVVAAYDLLAATDPVYTLFDINVTGAGGAGLPTTSDYGYLAGGVQNTGEDFGLPMVGNYDLGDLLGTTGLKFEAGQYGSNAFVSVKTLSGTFALTDSGGTSSDRSVGTDIDVRVNGIQAIGDGLNATINTSALDLSFTVDSGVAADTTLTFSIIGGGAQFQLGPDVVSNQQARLGIQSVSTAKLGGLTGRLFNLRSGSTMALETDVMNAAKVVEEVITQVTKLRGRLGAFQKTTLETNIRSLSDTLENLTDAESSIRDADFAAESAALTRAQILVQSGVSVLAIANSNPQNVLALLR